MTLLQHARVPPFLDEPHHTPVRDAMLDELHPPSAIDRIEETAAPRGADPCSTLRRAAIVAATLRAGTNFGP